MKRKYDRSRNGKIYGLFTGLGIGDWGLGIGTNRESKGRSLSIPPIPNPQSLIPSTAARGRALIDMQSQALGLIGNELPAAH